MRDIQDDHENIENIRTELGSIQYENKQLREELDLVMATVGSQPEDIEMLKKKYINQNAISMRQTPYSRRKREGL